VRGGAGLLRALTSIPPPRRHGRARPGHPRWRPDDRARRPMRSSDSGAWMAGSSPAMTGDRAHPLIRPRFTRPPSPARGEGAAQCRKWRVPVNTIAIPAASATAITSASRIEPPGWMTAVAPASIAASRPSAKGKKASEATTEPMVCGSGQPAASAASATLRPASQRGSRRQPSLAEVGRCGACDGHRRLKRRCSLGRGAAADVWEGRFPDLRFRLLVIECWFVPVHEREQEQHPGSDQDRGHGCSKNADQELAGNDKGVCRQG
jgi:hypothetical protein